MGGRPGLSSTNEGQATEQSAVQRRQRKQRKSGFASQRGRGGGRGTLQLQEEFQVKQLYSDSRARALSGLGPGREATRKADDRLQSNPSQAPGPERKSCQCGEACVPGLFHWDAGKRVSERHDRLGRGVSGRKRPFGAGGRRTGQMATSRRSTSETEKHTQKRRRMTSGESFGTNRVRGGVPGGSR